MLTATDIVPYKPIKTGHEAKFATFLAHIGREDLCRTESRDLSAYAIQYVQQQNFGPIETKRWFGTSALLGGDDAFKEISESDMLALNLKKLNTYKNFKSKGENRFYEINVYCVDPKNEHHWRVDIARPATEIDL